MKKHFGQCEYADAALILLYPVERTLRRERKKRRGEEVERRRKKAKEKNKQAI